MYCDQHSGITYEGLKDVFPGDGAKRIIEKKENVKDPKRFSRCSVLLENGVEMVVSTQWCRGPGGNIEKFLKLVEKLNLNVTKV